ncbi:unnamed protein product, partial [Chrysoparadoxa australica]
MFYRELQHGELARDKMAMHHAFGIDCRRLNNLKYIEDNKA